MAGLLGFTVLASGCMGGGGDGGLNIGPGGKTVTVTDFEIQPRSILAGSGTQINVGVVNTGTMDANVSVGEDGKKILRNFCPDIFSISSFSAYSSRVDETRDSYTLTPGGELQLRWSLQNTNTASVPTYGYKCSTSLQIPFDYSVSAYQQIQVKRDREVQGATNLQSRTSEGPMNIHLEMIGSSSEKGAPTFINGDNMEVLVQMENTAPEESSYQGLVDLQSPEITTSERFKLNKSTCNMRTRTAGAATGSVTAMADTSFSGSGSGGSSGNLVNGVVVDQQMRLYQGESRIIRCNVVLAQQDGEGDLEGEMEVPSVRGQVESQVNYSYIKDLGDTQIEVEPRG